MARIFENVTNSQIFVSYSEGMTGMYYLFLLQGVPWAGIWWLETLIFYILIVLSAVVAVNILTKYKKFLDVKKHSRRYVPRVAPELRALEIAKAIKLSKEFEKKSHLAAVVLAGLKEYVNLKEFPSKEMAFKHAKESMERSANGLKFEYEKGVGFLDSVGRTAPFIGALGGSALTFALGILIAIPAVWFATYERNKSGSLVVEIKNAAWELMEFLEKRL